MGLVIREDECHGQAREYEAYVREHYPDITIEFCDQTSGRESGLFSKDLDGCSLFYDMWSEYCNAWIYDLLTNEERR